MITILDYGAGNLRSVQNTLTEIGVEKNTTIVFPLPIEFMQLIDRLGAKPGAPKVSIDNQ